MIYFEPPRDKSPEEWLSFYGTPIQVGRPNHLNGHQILVCLVEGKRIAIAHNQQALTSLADPGDYRSKAWFIVNKSDIGF